MTELTRGLKGHISCAWVQCATFWGIDKGGHFCLPIGTKNTNLVENVKILLPVKFHWIPFSGFRGEIKMSRQSEARAAILFFWSANYVENVGILLPVKFSWIPFGSFRGEVENVSANQRPGWPSCFSQKTQTWYRMLRSRFMSSFVEFCAEFSEKSKMSQPIRGQGGHLVFPIGPKNTNLVEDIEILLHFKFRWILFSGFRGEVQNVSANQRPGWPSCFSNRPEKHKLGRGPWDLASCQVSLNSVQQFQRRSRKCLSQSEARMAILFFLSARKTQTW